MKQISRHSLWFNCGALALFVTLPHCKPRNADSVTAAAKTKGDDAADSNCGKSAACSLPSLLSGEEVAAIEQVVRQKLERKAPPQVVDEIAPKIAHYLSFLGIPATERQMNDSGNPVATVFDKTLARVLESSTQFLVCESFEDWACLQQDPDLVPKAAFRQPADKDKGILGAPVNAGRVLDMDIIFTQRYDSAAKWTKDENVKTMSYKLAEYISDPANKKISMAAYGIRSILPEESMYPVFKAIGDQVKKKVDVRAVTDQVGQFEPKDEKYVYFTYVDRPTEDLKGDTFSWAFSQPNPRNIMPKATPEDVEDEDEADEEPPAPSAWISFTYANTPDLLRLLNQGITPDGKVVKKAIAEDEEAKARLEWPSAGIMHNKFLVFEDGSGPKSVWTGTTNLSDSCMGEEKNSNLGVFIRNKAIASTFLQEFDEMFEYQKDEEVQGDAWIESKKIVNPFSAGRFHRNKRPNTRRYFTMDDGTELTVHFSPTDDAEHRSILPVLLSAKKGDVIRISMFGNSGIDYVRAIQYAVAKGADVRLLMDYEQGAGSYSWVGKKAPARLQEPNPFPEGPEGAGTLEIRKGGKSSNPKNGWAGKNHHKSATLTHGDGTVEYFLTGSQNWSVGGNDKNDENMISIRNPKGVMTKGRRLDKAAKAPVMVGNEFNDEFDNHMWPAAVPAKLKQ